MTENQIFDEAAELVHSVTRDGVQYFKGAIDKSGLVWTRELYNSVEGIVVNEAAGLGFEIEFTFKEYWRYLDMKQLNFSTAPNIDKMWEWLQKIPLSQIPYINGYNATAPTVASRLGEEKAKRRFLNSILAHRRKVPVVRHIDKRRRYNKTKSAYLRVLRGKLIAKLGQRIPVFLAERMQPQNL